VERAGQIAERIRALGYPAPGHLQGVRQAGVDQGSRGRAQGERHGSSSWSAQEATARTARKLFPVVEAANDQPTADVLTQRLDVHEKTAWMLRSLLEE
jgi:starvation-inducible DNA-binding protein